MKNGKTMSPLGAALFEMANHMNEVYAEGLRQRTKIVRPSQRNTCQKGHTWSGSHACPFCNPEESRLADFGEVGEKSTGNYNAETLLELETSHEALVDGMKYILANHENFSPIRVAWIELLISEANRVRRMAGLKC